MKKVVILSCICLMVAIASCNQTPDSKKEIQKVLDHFSKDPKDSLKLKAAKFLIENLDGLATLDTASVEDNQVYFDLIYNTWKHEKMRIGFRLPIQTRVIDSLNKADNLPQVKLNVRYVNDLDIVKADFLIKNIDQAFYVWQNMPWAKNVTFDDFCEYILPYRCISTYSLDAREFFLKRYQHLNDSVKNTTNSYIAGKFIVDELVWFAEDPNVTARYPYLQPIKFSNLLKAKFGDCQEANSVRVTALRALGIPAVMDEIPNWGNSNLNHYWYRIIDPGHDTVKTRITNKNIYQSTQHVISSSSFDVPDYQQYPPNIEVKYGRTVPKVYRRSFKRQLNSLEALRSPNDEIPPYFKSDRLKDVTNEYLETTDIKIKLDKKNSTQKYAYLCVFDNQKWVPIAWTVNNDIANFKAMGKNIVYLPAYYYNSNIVPAAKPFLVDTNGVIKVIQPSPDKEAAALYAKFPCRSYVLSDEHTMVGGRFQFANKEDLSDTITVHTVNNIPFRETEVEVTEKTQYRFLIFQFKNIPIAHMSELTFYGLDKNGKEVKLKGGLIGSAGSYPYKSERLVDGNRATFFKSAREDKYTYVGIDLGKGRKQRITKIVYMPHSDDNNVVYKDTYQLYYWKDQWISLGLEDAGPDNTVEFAKIPKNALLLLKNIDGGVEERIFTLNKGKQLFY